MQFLKSSGDRYRHLIAIAFFTGCICIVLSLLTPVAAESPDWIAKSNEYAELLENALIAEDCQPENAISESLLELDPSYGQCRQSSIAEGLKTLEQKQAQVKNKQLRVDLEILQQYGQRQLRREILNQQYQIPEVDLSQAILESLQATLKESQSPNQVQKQLAEFAGIETPKTPIAIALQNKIEVYLQQPEFILPEREKLRKDLNNNAGKIYKIQTFLQRQKIPDYENTYQQLKKQLFAYETFMRREVLTSKRSFRLPKEVYTLRLQQQGIKTPVAEMIEDARATFERVQKQMVEIAPQVAKEKGLEASQGDYRSVIKALQAEQLSPQATLRLYRQRARQLAKIIRTENIVSLPEAKFNLRLATPQENKAFPVPLYSPDSSTFVIPALRNPKQAKLYNDFTNPAMSWTLTAHEGRPGHDLQFATVSRQKLSRARTEFASNAANIEGWATYAETVMLPYMPLKGQLMSLQFQLLRAARAFLEPELQLGKITVEAARQVIIEDTGFSEFFAQQEIKRYTKTFVGQAPTYFYGARQFQAMRSQLEQQPGFSLQKFHDSILSQGYLEPELLKQVIIDRY